jgi:filamentous hemagglutinin family protein
MKISALRAAAVAACLSMASHAFAVGTGTIADGSGAIDKNGTITTVNQASNKLIVNWDNMNVGRNETLKFVQPDAKSSVLNRISSASPTSILGALNANGRVFVVNPNGVLIGNGARVNVGSLIASSLNISDADFNAGRLKFSGGGKGNVVNQGEITAAESVALIGSMKVENTGAITSTGGDVVLAAADNIRLSFEGSNLQAELSKGSLNALVNNGGLIVTQEGDVVLTAWARDSLARSVINNTGTLEATRLTARPGKMGDVKIQSMGNGEITIGGNASAKGWLYAEGRNVTFDGTATADVLKLLATRQATTTERASLQANTGRIAGGNFDFTRGETSLARLVMNVDSADMTLSGDTQLLNVYASDGLRVRGQRDVRLTHVTSGGDIDVAAAGNLQVEYVGALGDVTLNGRKVTE